MDATADGSVEIVDLVKHYTSRDGRVVRAVDGVSFCVRPGELVGLLGANGAGKTTTLRLLATLLKPTSGSVRVAGCDAASDPIGVRRSLGYLSATTGVPDRLTPREVVRSQARLHGLAGGPLAEAVEGVVAKLGLVTFADRPCGRLSSGQRQRVSLARALVHDPPVLVLDEPTSALDVVAARELMELLEAVRDAGHAVLLSTHRLHEIERRCGRFVILHEGRIVRSGTRDELVRDGAEDLEEAFFRALSA